MSPLKIRAKELVNAINTMENHSKIFNKKFLEVLPPEKLDEVFKNLTASLGKAIGVRELTTESATAGTLSIEFEKFIGKGTITIDEEEPNLVSGFHISNVETKTETLQGLICDLKKLPGRASLAAFKLEGEELKDLGSHNPDLSLAIGSAFKLYVLAELARRIEKGDAKWEDVIKLEVSSCPSGNNWPIGSPVTLHTLASMMISTSDNTATDQLIKFLGRESVENVMKESGHMSPELNIPFLTTSEFFKIKGDAHRKDFETEFINKTAKERRELLDEELSQIPNDKVDLGKFAKPNHIDSIEWFASCYDLGRIMNWLKQCSDEGDYLRGVLSINKGLPAELAKQWNYVGFKGGSESGVINLTYLLESKNGEWFVVTGSWNDTKANVDTLQFVGILNKAIELIDKKH
eukprot:TRINITY_DN3708_c1_g1_i1.p1 TRINITY_DN3708_c1_g1~~TRINITY_DN3708_c1_g1_i1.p1  ORF type:complete len:465 (-),score=99.23 TRINITY_DN3708_c1_g1_i1:159-1376(-)